MSDDDRLTCCVRQAIAAHLAIPYEDVGPDTTIGDDLALDSLDVFAVIAATGELLGRTVSLDYRDPAAVDRLVNLGSLTVAHFARCLAVA